MIHPVADDQCRAAAGQQDGRPALWDTVQIRNVSHPGPCPWLDFYAQARSRYDEGEWRQAAECVRQSLAAMVGEKVDEEDQESDVADAIKEAYKESGTVSMGYGPVPLQNSAQPVTCSFGRSGSCGHSCVDRRVRTTSVWHYIPGHTARCRPGSGTRSPPTNYGSGRDLASPKRSGSHQSDSAPIPRVQQSLGVDRAPGAERPVRQAWCISLRYDRTFGERLIR